VENPHSHATPVAHPCARDSKFTYWDATESRLVPDLEVLKPSSGKEHSMANDQQSQEQQAAAASPTPVQKQDNNAAPDDTDGLKDKKPEELTAEELRLMADTMPGEGPGD
jgi:hypothetical protein